MEQNRIPGNTVYETFGLSGCYFCPFYHEQDFLRLKKYHPELFAKLLKCEEQIGKRALPDFWLRDFIAYIINESNVRRDIHLCMYYRVFRYYFNGNYGERKKLNLDLFSDLDVVDKLR